MTEATVNFGCARLSATAQALLIHAYSGAFRRAGLAKVPEQSRHQTESFACDRRQQVLVRGMLRAAGVGMRHPDGLELEHVDENVVRQRAPEIRQDDRRMTAGAFERGRREADPGIGGIEPARIEEAAAAAADLDLL